MDHENEDSGAQQIANVRDRNEMPAKPSISVTPVTAGGAPPLPWEGVRKGRDGLLRRIENVLGSIS